jgi:hypothetical protein
MDIPSFAPVQRAAPAGKADSGSLPERGDFEERNCMGGKNWRLRFSSDGGLTRLEGARWKLE